MLSAANSRNEPTDDLGGKCSTRRSEQTADAPMDESGDFRHPFAPSAADPQLRRTGRSFALALANDSVDSRLPCVDGNTALQMH